MKKTILMTLAALSLCSCYETYVKDYDYSAVYAAYQYDLRSFVVGEGMEFSFGVQLAGMIDNDRDRDVSYVIDNALVNGDLSSFTAGDEQFTALDVMNGTSAGGTVSQDYVTTAIKAAKLSQLTPLPESLYSLSSPKMVLGRGRHTATVSVKADSAAMLADPNIGYNPYYAIGWKITSADADTVLLGKSFEVIAVRIENQYFGHWYHSGRTVVRNDMSTEVLSESYESGAVPQDDNKVYELTTIGPNSVKTSRLGNKNGSLRLDFNGNDISISCADATGKVIETLGDSYSNGAVLLQDRRLYLNYRYSNGDGTTTYVHDTLSFRNRMRDGVNEWQDPNPSHYE